MVGAILGAAAQVGSSIYGAIKSSQANRKAQQMIQNQRDENKRWYDQKMAEDYTQRSDAQNILRKQRELLQDQYQRARATNLVAGGTDESLALQQAQASEAMGETMADIASQASAYKDSIEQQYRAKDDALNQQMVGIQQNKANSIAKAAGQMGSAVSGLVQGGMDNLPGNASGASEASPATKSAWDGVAEAQMEEKVKSGVPKLKI